VTQERLKPRKKDLEWAVNEPLTPLFGDRDLARLRPLTHQQRSPVKAKFLDFLSCLIQSFPCLYLTLAARVGAFDVPESW
jgi:hypothetical protein